MSTMQEAFRPPRAATGTVVGRASPAALALVDHVDTREDPVELINAQAQTRYAEFVPIRHSRMAASAFAFYRGTAILMARDLAAQPSSGLRVQLCGDAHVANFGLFAGSDRRPVFDVNDFDETWEGPFEWDLKRLSTSFVVAARNSGLKPKTAERAAARVVTAYRDGMVRHAAAPALAVSYQRIDGERSEELMRAEMGKEGVRRVREGLGAATARDSWSAVRKLTEVVDGERRFVDAKPLIQRVPLEGERRERVLGAYAGYRRSLPPRSRRLLDQYRVVDFGHKIVGVGSIGLYAWVLLLEGRTPDDLLILQIKQAERSVFDPQAPDAAPSAHYHAGRRVVLGQQAMQASTDIMLGWTTGPFGRQYYVRQLRDMKWSPPLDDVHPKALLAYATLTGTALALAHARTGDPVPIAEYLGVGGRAVKAIAAYAVAYAERVDDDYRAFTAAIAEGRVKAG